MNKMTENITIREASDTDIDSIHEIELDSFTVPWSKKSFESALKSENIKIYAAIKEGGNIIGFGCAASLPPESEILNIAVSKSHRGLGIGKQLLLTMLEYAKSTGAESAYLEVRESNTPAMTLYEKAGFIKIGIRKNYYTKPAENAVIMVKNLCST